MKGWATWLGHEREFSADDVRVSLTCRKEGLLIDTHGNDELLDVIERAVMEAVAKFAPVEPGRPRK